MLAGRNSVVTVLVVKPPIQERFLSVKEMKIGSSDPIISLGLSWYNQQFWRRTQWTFCFPNCTDLFVCVFVLLFGKGGCHFTCHFAHCLTVCLISQPRYCQSLVLLALSSQTFATPFSHWLRSFTQRSYRLLTSMMHGIWDYYSSLRRDQKHSNSEVALFAIYH